MTKRKKSKRGSSRYRQVQGALSAFTHENNIHLGKNFNKAASRIHQKTKNNPFKFIAQNIDQLFRAEWPEGAGDAVGKIPEIEREFQREIPWWNFLDDIQTPTFEGVKIVVHFKDRELEEHLEGDNNTIPSMFKERLYGHLRRNYSGASDSQNKEYATMVLTNTDNKTFVEYSIDIHEAIPPGEEPSAQAPTQPEAPPPAQPAAESEIDKQIRLKELELKVEEAKLKRTELENERLRMIIGLKDAGFTPAEINALLGR